MDRHIPLLEWAKGTPYENARESSAKPIKDVITELFSAFLWLEMGSTFDDLDTSGDGSLVREEVASGILASYHDGETLSSASSIVVETVWDLADRNGDGKITPLEMMTVRYLALDRMHQYSTNGRIEALQTVVAETLGESFPYEMARATVEKLADALDAETNGTLSPRDAFGIVQQSSLPLST
jgi:Ca2+-binding EF-hand superfamily protein